MRRLLGLLLLVLSLPAAAQTTILGATIVGGSGGGGTCPTCALTNVSNVFTLNNTFPSLSVTNGVNGLDLYENTGLFNIGLGVGSTSPTATGGQNLGIGDGTLANLTNGVDNVAQGVAADGSVTTGQENIAFGTFDLQDNQTGNGNGAFGSLVLANLLNGSNNYAGGEESFSTLTTGNNNTAWGAFSGCGTLCSSTGGPVTTVSDSGYFGFQAGPSANSVTNQWLFGYNIQSAASNVMILGDPAIAASTIYGLPTFPQLGGSGAGCVGISNSGVTSVTTCGGGGGGATYQVNGVGLISSTTIDFINGAGIAITNPSAGNIDIAASFAGLGAGTNTGALLIGSGGSLGATGSGTITATSMPYSGLTGSVPTWNQNTTGTSGGLSGSPAITVSNVTDSALTAGDCVQATTGGLLVTTGAACGSGGGGSSFSVLTSGTNSAAAMVVGTGGSLGTSGSGTIAATTATTAAGPTGTPTLCSSGQGATGVGSSFAAQGCTTFLQGSLTAGNVPRATGTSTLGSSALSDNGTQVTSTEPFAVTSSFPGVIDLTAGTGTLPAAPSNSYGWIAPVTGGTPYDIQNPSTAAAGFLEYAAPTTVNGRNVIKGSFVSSEFTFSTGTGVWGEFGTVSPVPLNSFTAVNSGHVVKLTSVYAGGATCTTGVTVGIYDNTTLGYTVTGAIASQAVGTVLTTTNSMAYSAGDVVTLAVTGTEGNCPGYYNVTATMIEP